MSNNPTHPSRRTLLKVGLGAGGVLALAAGSFKLTNALVGSLPIAPPSPPTPQAITPGKQFPVRGVAWSPDSKAYAIVIGKAQRTLQVWRSPQVRQWQQSVPHIRSLAWSPASSSRQLLAVGSDDGNVRILDAPSGQTLLTYQGHGNASVLSLAWSSLGHGLASGDISGQIRVWNPQSGATSFTLTQPSPVTDLAWGGIYLVAAGAQPGQQFTIWDTRAMVGAFLFHNTYGHPSGALTATGWSANAHYLVLGDAKGNISLFSNTNCSCWIYITSVHAHTGQVNALSWTSDNTTFATASADGTLQIWQVITTGQTGNEIHETLQHQYTERYQQSLSSVAWSPDGRSLLTEESAGTVDFQGVV